MEDLVIWDLDGNGTADALARSQSVLVAAEVAQVELVAHWADLHGLDTRSGQPAAARTGGQADGPVLPGTERAVRPGDAGAPVVREFAAAELGVLLAMTTTGARWLLRDVLDLRHRHPLLWEAVRSGRARFWQAREIARSVRHAGLDLEQARAVDARTAAHLGLVPWGRMLGLVEAGVVEADPEAAERRRLEKAVQRFVHVGASDHRAFKTLYARLAAGDAIKLDAM